MGLTYLNPDAIKDASIEGNKIKDGSISSSKIDETVASKSYVDTAIKDELTQKQDTINDLESIRQGAAKGATSIQAVDTGDVVDDITIEYATKSYVDGLVGNINSVLESIINS